MIRSAVRRAIVAAFVMLAMSGGLTQTAAGNAQSETAAHKFTFDGDAALLTVAIKPDKTADFERIMTKVRQALLQSPDPQRKQQAAGWRVMRVNKPLADGNIAYVHVIHPVVKDADYTIMRALYEAFPEERQALYDTYRGAFAQNLSLATGSIVVDLSNVRP
ncbi:MAG TPA: hypothetical protein VFO67_06450 [Gemmatimonadales bacterium]|nr:hypothetical protein [Gemmatimonadales bacterium]